MRSSTLDIEKSKHWSATEISAWGKLEKIYRFYRDVIFTNKLILLYFIALVMTVTSLRNIRSAKSLLMSQQDEGDEESVNAVSFPASVLRGSSPTGKKCYTYIHPDDPRWHLAWVIDYFSIYMLREVSEKCGTSDSWVVGTLKEEEEARGRSCCVCLALAEK